MSTTGRSGSTCGFCAERRGQCCSIAMPTSRINFLDVRFDRRDLDDVVERLASARARSAYAYVVTPNVDHVVRIHREPELKRLYDGADFCLCDSRVLRLLARLSGIRLPLVAGSDLTSKLF